MRRLAAAAAALAVLAAPAVADAAGHRIPTRAEAREALQHAQQLRAGRGVRTGFELSPALARLAAALPALSGDDRRAAEALLSRPDDTQQDPADTHKWSVPEAGHSPFCTAHLCIHWVGTSADAPDTTDSDIPKDNVPDYVEQMASILETEVVPCENGTGATACGLVAGPGGGTTGSAPGLGWREPTSDGGLGTSDLVDVYIQNLFPSRVFGYVAVDPDQPRESSVPHHSYMVLDKDYARFANGSASGGLEAERVTAAHEYNHILQNVYDYLEDGWMFESTAVWAEDKVYPQINDYLRYVEDWAAYPGQPLTTSTQSNLKPYGSAVWNHFLNARYGDAIVRSAWERSAASRDFAPSAYNAAITAAGGAGFGDEFGRLAAASSEWLAPGTGFPDSYVDVARAGTLPVETITAPFALAHTTFALFDVPIPASAPTTIRLTAMLPANTAGAVALVGRTGTDPHAGQVTTNLTQMPAGGTAAAALDNPSQYGRITAVVVNSDPSQSGFDPLADDYVFTRDANGVTLALAEPGPPLPVTGSATQIEDHRASVDAMVDPHLLDTTWSIEYGRTTAYGTKTAPLSLPASTIGSAPVVRRLDKLRADTTYHYRVIATNAAGATAGADSTFKTARDVTKPRVVVKVKRQRADRIRKSGLRYLLRCSERCLGSAQVVLKRTVARRLGLPVVLAKTRVALAARPRSTTLRIRLTSTAKERLAGVSRAFAATLRIKVADEAKNSVVAQRRANVLRPRR